MILDQKNQITAILISKEKAPRETFPWYQQAITINPIKDSASKRNLVLKQAKTRWVIFLKSNEIVPKSLVKEIKNFVDRADRQGFTGAQIIIKKSFLEKNLNYGNWATQKEIRLGRRVGEWKEDNGKFFWQFPGQKATLSNPIISNPYDNLASLLADINLKSTAEAQRKHQKGKRMFFLDIIVLPLITFKRVFLLKLGLLDGLAGFILAILEAFQTFLEKSKFWLLKQQEKEVTVDS